MKTVKCSLLLISLIIACSSFAKEGIHRWKFHFVNYSISEGLPSQEAYDVITDNRGYLYISTDRGIMRYDGKQFVPVRFASYQKDYTLFEFVKDETGRIWCSSYDQGLYYLEKEKLYPYRYNGFLNKIRAGDLVDDFYADKDGVVYFYLKRFGSSIGRIDTTGRFNYVVANAERPDTYQAFVHGEKMIPLLFRNKDPRPWAADTIHLPAVQQIPGFPLPADIFVVRKVRGQHTAFGGFIAVGNVLAVNYAGLNRPFDHYVLPEEILCFEQVDTSLWVGTRKGLYYFPSLFNLNNYEVYFPSLGFNGICKDHQNGIWFTSLQQGVFYLSPRRVEVLDFHQPVNEFSIENDSVMNFTASGNIAYSAIFNNAGLQVLNKRIYKGWMSSVNAVVKKKYALPNNITALCFYEGFLLYSDKDESTIYDSRINNMFTQRVLSVALFRDTFWIGTVNGIYLMAGSHISKWKQSETELNVKIADIKLCNEQLWIATLGQGLYSYDGVLKPHPEVPVSFAESIFVDEDNDVWVSSNAGIFLCTAKNWLYFSRKSSLPPSYISKVLYQEGKVYGLAGSKLFRFIVDKDRLYEIAPYSKLQISYSVDGLQKEYNRMKSLPIEMNKEERHFRAVVNNPNFESGGYTLAYRMGDNDTGWTYVDGNAFTLTDIPPGKHQLQVKYTERINLTRPYIFTLNLVKEPRWTQTLWFLLLLVLCGGIITIPLGIFITKGILEKRKLYYEKILADQRVLSTQLNPHFTYNALNSMQLLLCEKEWERALNYNEHLGEILRRVFRQSEHTFVPLSRELTLVKEYLDLEKIRLHRQVDFIMTLSENVNADNIPVPPLLIQPLVENAIWHGYRRERNQQFEIQCTVTEMPENTIRISIADNGKGFDHTKGKTTHSALKNMQHRIELLNSSRMLHIGMEMFSPQTSDGRPGTETILTIHYLYEKESNHYRR